MPSPSRDEDCGSRRKRVRLFVQNDASAAFQNVKGFLHFEMPMDRNAGAAHHLLRAQRKTSAAVGRAELDENVAAVAKMNEVLALFRACYEPLGLFPDPGKVRGKHPAAAKAREAGQEGTPVLLNDLHDHSP